MVLAPGCNCDLCMGIEVDSVQISSEQWHEYLNLVGTKEAILNEQRYQSERSDPTDYIALHDKIDELGRKMEDVLAFIDEVKQGIEQAANSSGMFGGLIRSFMKKGV